MKQLLIILGFTLMLGCKETPKDTLAANTNSATAITLDEGVIINMDGKTYVLPQDELFPVNVKTQSDSLNYALRTNKSDVSLNLNLINTGIIKKKSHAFKIPEDIKKSFLIGLSFFNKSKDVSRLNKRIVFRKGTIDIKEVTESTLKVIFEGEGSGMRDIKNSFPISGSVNIKY